MIKVALLTTDSREHFRDYGNPQPYFGTAPEALLEGFKMMPQDIEVHIISCLQQKPISSPAKLASNIYYHALHVPNIGWMKSAYMGCTSAVRRRLRQIKPDIVHGQGTERDCAMCAVLSGFPNVLTIHGNIAQLARIHRAKPGSFPWLQAKLENWCLPRTAGVLCNSAYTESLVSPRARKCWRVPNPLRSKFFKQAAGAIIGDPIVLNVGVICPRKRQVELLDLAKSLYCSGFTSLKWQFAGQLSTRDEYGRLFTDRLQQAQSSGYAEYLGVLDAEALIRAMDGARALVHFPYEEAFGLVVAEAMARGLQFFGSDLGGIRDIAENVKGAQLVPASDFGELRTRLKLWLEQGSPTAPDNCSAMHERYRPEVVAAIHRSIYDEVVSIGCK
jgi:glycosyltransferase involved in cell wall biosynthesis